MAFWSGRLFGDSFLFGVFTVILRLFGGVLWVQCIDEQSYARVCIYMQISAKINENCAKICPLLPIQHLFLLTKRSKSTFQPMKWCSKWACLGAAWVDSECFFICIFMKSTLLSSGLFG